MTNKNEIGPALGYDPDFAPLYGQPGWQPDTEWIVDTSGSGAGSRALKAFIEQAASSSSVHLPNGIVGAVNYNGEKWECRFTLPDGQEYLHEAETRDAVVMAAARFINDRTTKPDVVEPTETQLNFVARLAQSGRVQEAIAAFLNYSVTNKKISDRKIISSPKYADLCDRAVWFVWSQANNEYSLNDDEFPRFLETFASGKRFTVELLNHAWKLHKEHNAKRTTEQAVERLREPEPTEQALNAMTDSEVQEQLSKVARARAGR